LLLVLEARWALAARTAAIALCTRRACRLACVLGVARVRYGWWRRFEGRIVHLDEPDGAPKAPFGRGGCIDGVRQQNPALDVCRVLSEEASKDLSGPDAISRAKGGTSLC
jgi:hypothetical protein